MSILLVRHASAGSRSRWKGDDRSRPLDKRGRRQAQRLVEGLAPYAVRRIVTSPYVRCVQTVEPLAGTLELPIEEREELAEGAGPLAALSLLGEVQGETAVLCSHGDVILDLVGWEQEARKGSIWILELDGDRFAPAVYLPPPK